MLYQPTVVLVDPTTNYEQKPHPRTALIPFFPCVLHMFQVGLASGLGHYTQVVRDAQKGIKLRNVRFVDAMGLPLQDGHLHLSTQAQVQLGHMLAQSYLNDGTSQL